MKGENLFEAMSYIDAELIEKAVTGVCNSSYYIQVAMGRWINPAFILVCGKSVKNTTA